MRALQYFFAEAAESLWRNRRGALLSMLTIAAGMFVLGFFLMINANIARIVDCNWLTLHTWMKRHKVNVNKAA